MCDTMMATGSEIKVGDVVEIRQNWTDHAWRKIAALAPGPTPTTILATFDGGRMLFRTNGQYNVQK